MSDDKKLDSHLKNAFGNYSPDVPLHIWDNIMAERKKKKPVAFWMNQKNLLGLSALLILLAAGGMVFYKKTDKANFTEENKTANTKNVTVPSASAIVLTDNKINILPEEKSTNSILDDDIKSASPNNKNNSSISTGKEKNDITDGVTDKPQRNRLNKNTNPVSDVLVNDITDNAISSNNTHQPKKTHKRTKGKLSIQSSAVDVEEAETTEIIENKIAETQTQQAFSMNHLLYGPQKLSAAELAALNKTINPNALRIPGCPADKDAAGNKQYWEIYLGPDRAFKKYSDTANSALLEKRKASTSFQSAYSAGVRYTRVFDNGMSLRTGINFSQINEKFTYLQSNVVQLTYEIGANGDTINTYYVRGTKYRNSYNHYRTIDVPLLIGYELGYGRFHANINAGAVVNIYSWQNGETLDTTFKPVSFGAKENSPYQYKSNIGIGFMGGISFYYKLNDRYHLLAEPYYRYNFSPMNKENLSIQEKFSTMGIRLGLRIDF